MGLRIEKLPTPVSKQPDYQNNISIMIRIEMTFTWAGLGSHVRPKQGGAVLLPVERKLQVSGDHRCMYQHLRGTHVPHQTNETCTCPPASATWVQLENAHILYVGVWSTCTDKTYSCSQNNRVQTHKCTASQVGGRAFQLCMGIVIVMSFNSTCAIDDNKTSSRVVVSMIVIEFDSMKNPSIKSRLGLWVIGWSGFVRGKKNISIIICDKLRTETANKI